MEKKNIVFFTPVPPPYGGIANWTIMLDQYLKLNEKNIVYHFIDTSPNKRDMDGRTIFDRIIYSGFKMLKNIRTFKMLIKKEKIDVIHINTSGRLALIRDYCLIKIAKKYKIRTVLHFRFGRIPELLQKNTTEGKKLLKCIKACDRIVVIDQSTYNTLKQKGYKNVYLIANPIDEKEITIEFHEKEQSISFVGWVIKEKGIEELLSSWEELNKKHTDWTLKLIGPYKNDYLSELCKKYSFNNIQVFGEVDHEKALSELQKSSIFVLPSYTEGFPNVILESMFLGTPIIASRVGEIPNILQNECGLLIDSKRKDQLKSALEFLMDNKSARFVIANNAIEECKKYYISNIIEKYKKVWFFN
ncbi:MAG: glycosyltransferase family 4 protein [Candidatus Onthovivens sp.]|nr:glycosyltransferase family 4 protein [Candidatus Onthovivens sp.]